MDEQIVISVDKYDELLRAEQVCRMLKNLIRGRRKVYDGLNYNDLTILETMMGDMEDTE